MEFKVNIADLKQAFDCILEVKKSTMPILESIQIETGKNVATFFSTDLEFGTKAVVNALVAEPGNSQIPAAKIRKMIKQFKDGVAVFSSNGGVATISIGSAKSTICETEKYDLGIKDKHETGSAYVEDCRSFFSAVENARKFAAGNCGNPSLRNIIFDSEDNGMKVVATDSYNLCISDFVAFGLNGSFSISSNIAKIITKAKKYADSILIREYDDSVTFEFNCSFGRFDVSAKKNDYRIIPWRRVIEQNTKLTVEIDSCNLRKSINFIDGMVESSSPCAIFDFGSMVVSAKDEQSAVFHSIVAKADGDDTILMYVNPSYMKTIAECLPNGIARISCESKHKAFIIDGSDGSKYLIMPIRH